jgi:hypothetical protein
LLATLGLAADARWQATQKAMNTNRIASSRTPLSDEPKVGSVGQSTKVMRPPEPVHQITSAQMASGNWGELHPPRLGHRTRTAAARSWHERIQVGAADRTQHWEMNDPSTYLRSITVSVLGGLAKEL